MAIYSMTLDEVMTIPNFHLFQEHPYIDYPHVQKEILEEFGQQEIAFETPDLFKRKLNQYLALYCDNYNKMLHSEMIKLDPFITEYIESDSKSHTKRHEGESTVDNYTGYSETDSIGNTKQSGTESYSEQTSDEHKQENSGVETKSVLTSEAENRDTTVNETGHTEHTEDTTEEKTTNENDVTDTTITLDRQTSDNQTGRNWTENGSSEGHNLDVHSDTPNAMLFNVPNHYYGTGRAHNYGEVVKDSQGNDVYQHYAETNPDTIDSANLEINGGDSPWFNYASTADNKTGHDSYQKEGTETYNKSGTQKDSQTEKTTGTKDIEEHGTTNVSFDENTERDSQTEDSVSRNKDESTVDNTHTDEDYKGSGTKTHDGQTGQTVGTASNSKVNDINRNDQKRDLHTHEDNDNSAVSKGRRMFSPSKLLEDYRETLTYNCDAWLLGQLEPLFMQIF